MKDTAAQTGRSERSVELDAERGEKIADDVKDAIAGTPLDKGNVLDELKQLPPEQQRERVKEKQAASTKPKAPKGKPAKPLLQGTKLTEEERTERDRTRLNKAWEPVRTAWNEACLPAQREFVRKLARDLNAEIKFAGETAKAPPPSL